MDGASNTGARTSSSSRFTPSSTNVFELDPIVIVIAVVFGILLTALQYYFEGRDAGKEKAKVEKSKSRRPPSKKTVNKKVELETWSQPLATTTLQRNCTVRDHPYTTY